MGHILKIREAGSISVFVLLIGVVFSIVMGGLAMMASVEYTNVRRTEARFQALAIAEAGVNYYRWHLAHDPSDFTDGTGQPGPYEHTYNDTGGGKVGTFSLEITPPQEGSQIITVRSTGWTHQFPLVKRTVTVRFGPVPLTAFSFLHNSNVWFGNGMTIDGEVLSNGGVRMDGTNTSKIASTRQSYTCGIETGCVHEAEKPGVWGDGGPIELWEYPVPMIDFNGIVTDFAMMKVFAQSGGLYLPPSNNFGYHLVFNSEGSVSVYQVETAENYKGWEVEAGCVNLYQTIVDESLLGTYSLENKRIIYAENTVWVEGVAKGQVTVVAARLPVESYNTDIWINGNITYEARDGINSLGLIAQRDIIFALDIPQHFYIDAAMLAQNGRVLRHHYNMSQCSSSNKSNRNTLEVYGSIISNKKSYWNFSGPQGPTSGFTKRVVLYNDDAGNEPPPFFPYTGRVKLLSWEEE